MQEFLFFLLVTSCLRKYEIGDFCNHCQTLPQSVQPISDLREPLLGASESPW